MHTRPHSTDGANILLVGQYSIYIEYEQDINNILYRVYLDDKYLESFSSLQQAFTYCTS
ncbi:hypothetical protein AVT44_gp02 [Acinetobacter phage Fri1]|uniref:Uncharacterized protein n=1 Tax=Acinetobacter phage Fri1 TaxID=1647373 RepID=A0A0H4THX6_9CAUD|nr:hypothetical protein AVT44_gp02 [Acinetobacter phage Fri1]AKQ06807.1 hypothetical protein Fri1_2 [Acinetobacter phage Fri1]